MKVERKSKFYVFLMEYLWSILFFMLACIVCVQLFVESYKTSNLVSDKNDALLIGQALAEDLRMNMIDETDGFILIAENHYQKNTDKFVIDVYQTPKALDYVESTIEISNGDTVLINFTVMSGGQ